MPLSAPPRSPAGPRRLDLRAAAQALGAHPDGSLTMAQVAAQLGVAKPTLYRLAGSKAQLLGACLDAEAERLLDHLHEALVGPDSRAATLLERTLVALAGYAGDSPGGFVLLFERWSAEADVRVRRVESRVADLLRHDARSAGRQPPELIVAGLLGAAAAVVARSRRAHKALDAAAAAAELGAAMTAAHD